MKRRKYGKLSEQSILSQLKRGVLRVNIETGQVFTNYPGRGLVQKPAEPDRENRYLFVRIYEGAKRTKIALNRLVWMAAHKKPIQEGHDIHHGDTNKRNNHWLNLKAEPSRQHRSEASNGYWNEVLGYPVSWDDVEAEWESFTSGAIGVAA